MSDWMVLYECQRDESNAANLTCCFTASIVSFMEHSLIIIELLHDRALNCHYESSLMDEAARKKKAEHYGTDQ